MLLAANDLREIADVVDDLNAVVALNAQLNSEVLLNEFTIGVFSKLENC